MGIAKIQGKIKEMYQLDGKTTRIVLKTTMKEKGIFPKSMFFKINARLDNDLKFDIVKGDIIEVTGTFRICHNKKLADIVLFCENLKPIKSRKNKSLEDTVFVLNTNFN